MKRLLASLFLALLFAVPAQAEEAAPANSIAVINIQSIMNDASAAKSVRDQLQKKQKAFQDELKKKEDELKKEDDELVKQRSILAQDAFEKKVRDFKAKATAAQKEVQSKKAQLDHGFEEAVNTIQKTVIGIVADVAKEKKLTLVLPTSQTLYAAPNMDITAETLKRLNSKLPNVTVNFK
jgi:Skp family chaperone for outer membrane proteins